MSGAECQSGTCAPATTTSGTASFNGHFVCKANDGQAYDGAVNGTTCAAGLCAVTSHTAAGALLGTYCALPCPTAEFSSPQCGGNTCIALGSGTCNTAIGFCGLSD